MNAVGTTFSNLNVYDRIGVLDLHRYARRRIPHALAGGQIRVHVLLRAGFDDLHPLHPAAKRKNNKPRAFDFIKIAHSSVQLPRIPYSSLNHLSPEPTRFSAAYLTISSPIAPKQYHSLFTFFFLYRKTIHNFFLCKIFVKMQNCFV